jgi:hypothetical protein
MNLRNLWIPSEVERFNRDAGFRPARRNTRYEILLG